MSSSIKLHDLNLPPLLKKFSWTKAAPYKEEQYHRNLSDSIGNNYSPRAVDLKIKELGKYNIYSKKL